PAIFDRIKVLNNTNSSSLRHVLQNQYFNIYMREYGLTVVTQLPFARFSFVLGSNDLTNDYEALRAALATLGLWDLIANLSADSMLSLRYRDGYYRFRRLFDRVTQKAAS